jgi:lipase
MLLNTHRWGPSDAESVVCLHGVAQHGRVFGDMGKRLAALGHSVLAVDLRGHGGSDREPPWNTATHVADVLETLDAEGVERATLVGHSFGGLVAATLPPERAMRSAEVERLDWSFATADGAVNALSSNEAIVASPREVVAAFVEDDVRQGPDGRYRFSFCPSSVVVAWSEMTLPAPPIVQVPTLLVLAEKPLYDSTRQQQRYAEELGGLLTKVVAPNGHNVLWESPRETIGAIERLLEPVGEPVAE